MMTQPGKPQCLLPKYSLGAADDLFDRDFCK
jgi:hypothetical protein